MRKILLLLSVVLVFGCEPTSYKEPVESSKWVISKIERNDWDGAKKFVHYQAITTNETRLAVSNTWFYDTIGAYQIGDTLTFGKK